MSSMSFCLFPSFALRDSELVMSYWALGICRGPSFNEAKFCYCVRFNSCLCSSSTLNIVFFVQLYILISTEGQNRGSRYSWIGSRMLLWGLVS